MSALPPVARVALLFGGGVASSSLGVEALPLLLLLVVLAPIVASRRPGGGTLLTLVVVAGWLHGWVGTASCPSPLPLAPVGYFEAAPRSGGAPFRLLRSRCVFTAVVSGDEPVAAGRVLQLEGEWVQGARAHWLRVRSVRDRGDVSQAAAERRGAGVSSATGAAVSAPDVSGSRTSDHTGGLGAASARWRDGLTGRLHDRYGETAPMVAALILARREGLDRELRDGFARTGIAHLLAISGFHVGVVAGIVLALLRLVRVPRARAAMLGVVAIWAYVGLIGGPSAAVRAALILTFVSLSRMLNRPTAMWGPLGAALLVSLVWDPEALRSAGFQLSFAGAAGLLAWSGPVERVLRRGRPGRLGGLVPALATGIAATAATLPFVVWHFEQLSLVGIPATLLASPLVATAVQIGRAHV